MNIEKIYDKNGKELCLKISPSEGFKLHEKTLDEVVFDDDGNETGEVIQGFTKAYVTAGLNYDFEANSREIYEIIDG